MTTPTLLFAKMAALALGLLVSATAIHAEEPKRPDMTGLVKDQKGEPVPNAMVSIVAAGPRTGSSPLCPFNYPDCGKWATTDADGNFRLESLDPTLDFCVNALKPGYEPFVNSKLVPEAGPLKIGLKPRELSKVPPDRHVYGRILGPDGNPVANARLDFDGEEREGTTRWGGTQVDNVTLTDERGEFHAIGKKPFTAIHALIEAPGLAKRWARLEPGKMNLLRMNGGAAVKGRIVFRGRPVQGARIGIASVERACGKYLSGLRAVTGDDGRFEFPHLPRGVKFHVFSTIDSFRKTGASFCREFDSGADGKPIDLGEIQARPAHRLAGRVVLADGKPVPPGTRLMVDRPEVSDFSLALLDTQGRFEIAAVPEETVSIYLAVGGYHLSEKNPNLDSNHNGLEGRMTGALPDLGILLEPGKPPRYDEIDHPSYEEELKLKERPLRGWTAPSSERSGSQAS